MFQTSKINYYRLELLEGEEIKVHRTRAWIVVRAYPHTISNISQKI